MADENIVIPNLEENKPNNSNDLNSKNKNVNSSSNKHKVPMIVSIAMFLASFVFGAITLYYLMTIYITEDKIASFLAFILFLFTYGWLTYLPALATAIAGVATSAVGSHSSSKAIKITSRIFLILNILMLIAIIGVGLLVMIFPASLK